MRVFAGVVSSSRARRSAVRKPLAPGSQSAPRRFLRRGSSSPAHGRPCLGQQPESEPAQRRQILDRCAGAEIPGRLFAGTILSAKSSVRSRATPCDRAQLHLRPACDKPAALGPALATYQNDLAVALDDRHRRQIGDWAAALGALCALAGLGLDRRRQPAANAAMFGWFKRRRSPPVSLCPDRLASGWRIVIATILAARLPAGLIG